MGLWPKKFDHTKSAKKNQPTTQKNAGHIAYKNEIKKHNLTPHILPAGGTSFVDWLKESWKSTGKSGQSR